MASPKKYARLPVNSTLDSWGRAPSGNSQTSVPKGIYCIHALNGLQRVLFKNVCQSCWTRSRPRRRGGPCWSTRHTLRHLRGRDYSAAESRGCPTAGQRPARSTTCRACCSCHSRGRPRIRRLRCARACARRRRRRRKERERKREREEWETQEKVCESHTHTHYPKCESCNNVKTFQGDCRLCRINWGRLHVSLYFFV